MLIPSLSPDAIQKALTSQRLGKNIHWFETVNSTNVQAHALARQGAPEGDLVIAEEQTHGKGRLGRNWSSPSRLNLYLSLILRPNLPPAHAPQITLMAAVAVADTVQSFGPFPLEIKWPNDVLVGGRKIAGVLTESSSDGTRVFFVILGIGVNLNFPREQMPEEIRDKATSLIELMQKPVDRNAFAGRLIHNLDQCYGSLEASGFDEIARRWDGYFRLRGERVRVVMPEG
ncbi:MAG TPA: biotin--[acetyl-CoA-carboxylase] ligase, partial [Candidatus Binatia bacterium]